jgi:hypothetical protein
MLIIKHQNLLSQMASGPFSLQPTLCNIIIIGIYHKLVLTSLAVWLLERSYIYGGDKTLNTIFCFHDAKPFTFIVYFCHPNFVRMQQITDFYVV